MTCARSGDWKVKDTLEAYWPSEADATWDLCDAHNEGKGIQEYLDLVAEMKSPQECIIAVKREAKRRGYELESTQMSHHVVPEEDIRAHVTNGMPCPCLAQERGAPGVIIHNSYDGRELPEILDQTVKMIERMVSRSDFTLNKDDRSILFHARDLVTMHYEQRLCD